MKTISVRVIRTEMCGGGTAYDVYVPTRYKTYRPITCGCYATVICNGNGEYYRMDDCLRTEAIDNLPALFPELAKARKLPSCFAPWTLPSADKRLRVRLDLNAESKAGAR